MAYLHDKTNHCVHQIKSILRNKEISLVAKSFNIIFIGAPMNKDQIVFYHSAM